MSLFSGRSMVNLFEAQLGLNIADWASRGKWTNLGFVVYKLGRVMPGVITEKRVKRFNQRRPSTNEGWFVRVDSFLFEVTHFMRDEQGSRVGNRDITDLDYRIPFLIHSKRGTRKYTAQCACSPHLEEITPVYTRT